MENVAGKAANPAAKDFSAGSWYDEKLQQVHDAWPGCVKAGHEQLYHDEKQQVHDTWSVCGSEDFLIMVFSSLVFICIFLPCVWLLQLVLPSVRGKNTVLLIASILFYAYGEPVYVFLLLASALMNWILALLTDRGRNLPVTDEPAQARMMEHGSRHSGKAFLICAVLLNIGLLVVFKYAGFLTQTANALLHLNLPVPQIPLPIGISFYTFQALSYVIDVYRGVCAPQRNFFDLLLYISFFPQLIAGPIVKYRDIETELRERKITAEASAAGIRRFICGLGKKVLIANSCGVIADTLFGAAPELIWMPSAWLAAAAYLLQIYFDFSGYSDMAIGMGRMFGFHFRENFRYPYAARSVTDFWHRWHISLSAWFRDYLYIPLGGNRKGRARCVLNKFVVFLTCGIWHGANLTFLFWGFYHGLLLMAESLVSGKGRGSGKADGAGAPAAIRHALGHVYTILAVLTGFVFFRADTLKQGFDMAGKMFTAFRMPSAGARVLLWSVLTPAGITAMIAGAAACLPLRCLVSGRKWYSAAASAASLPVLAACILSLAGGTYNPFIYFRF